MVDSQAASQIFHSKLFFEVAPVRLFQMKDVGHGICSKQVTRVCPALLLNFAPAQNCTNSITLSTGSLAFTNHAQSLQFLNPPSTEPNDAAVGKHLQLCPVCEVASSEPCSCCAQDFCSNHIYSCVECDDKYCSTCFDAHYADGHWGDSDTAAEQARSRYIGDGQVCWQLDLSPAVYPACDQSNGRSTWTTLKLFRSFLALAFRRCVVVQQEACL
jgi:hypothetical protein